MRFSRSFTKEEWEQSEIADKHNIINIIPDNCVNRCVAASQVLYQPLRDAAERTYGKNERIYINSGYRCVQLNTKLRSPLTSHHIFDTGPHVALDIRARIATPLQLFTLLIKNNLPFHAAILEFRKRDNVQWLHLSWKSVSDERRILFRAV